MKFLFKLIPEASGRTPRAIASTTNAPFAVPINKETVVDIYNDYKWTKTLKQGRQQIPYIILKEHFISKSTFLTNLGYLLNSVEDFNLIKTKFFNNNPNIIEKIKDFTGVNVDEINRSVDKALGTAIDRANRVLNTTQGENVKRHMKPYDGLYGLEPTNFIYKLPYLDKEWKDVASSFGLNTASSNLVSFVESVGVFVDVIAEGFSYEAAKSFKYSADGPSKTINIFLDNTFDPENDIDYLSTSWQSNWQFVFLLCYQNIPNRINRFMVEPPMIYEATIPGLLYYPFSFIRNMQVKSLGVKHRKAVSIKEITEDNIEAERSIITLIPEAYEISITIESLVPETKNLFYESLTNNSNIDISIE